MICPRCKCEIADDSKVCEVCGKKLEKKKRFLKRSKAKSAAAGFKEENGGDTASKATKLKIIGAAVVTAALVIAVAFIISRIGSNSGNNTAKKLAEFIDKPILEARNETDIYLDDESNFDGLNNLTKFQYVVESEDVVKVDGVKYPEWAVLICLNDSDEIASVTYADFTVLKKNRKGVKTDGEIALDKVPAGEKYRKVASEIDIDPFAISYGQGTVTYMYRYYFINDYKDEQSMTISAVFDSDNNYMYSTSQRETDRLL